MHQSCSLVTRVLSFRLAMEAFRLQQRMHASLEGEMTIILIAISYGD